MITAASYWHKFDPLYNIYLKRKHITSEVGLSVITPIISYFHNVSEEHQEQMPGVELQQYTIFMV